MSSADVILNRGEATVKDLTRASHGDAVERILLVHAAKELSSTAVEASRRRKVPRSGSNAAAQDDILFGIVV
jgi:hypothetical protein